jgi:hypothetical protein
MKDTFRYQCRSLLKSKAEIEAEPIVCARTAPLACPIFIFRPLSLPEAAARQWVGCGASAASLVLRGGRFWEGREACGKSFSRCERRLREDLRSVCPIGGTRQTLFRPR